MITILTVNSEPECLNWQGKPLQNLPLFLRVQASSNKQSCCVMPCWKIGTSRVSGFRLGALDLDLQNFDVEDSLTHLLPGISLKQMANVSKKKKRRSALMLGLGLDNDGHKRLTTGPNFVLMGGSKETHEVMTEKAIRINEKLTAKGKKLED